MRKRKGGKEREGGREREKHALSTERRLCPLNPSNPFARIECWKNGKDPELKTFSL